MVILIDLDGPIADFEKGFLNKWRKKFPNKFFMRFEERKNFYIRDDYPQKLRKEVDKIYCGKKFILNLPVVKNGKEAVIEMLSMGHDVLFCSSPLSNYKNCVKEKYQWIEKNFGFNFTKKLILTKDKTLVKGDYLIDDKPEIGGIKKPEWEHLIFDAPYNREIKNKKRINWLNWKDVLEI